MTKQELINQTENAINEAKIRSVLDQILTYASKRGYGTVKFSVNDFFSKAFTFTVQGEMLEKAKTSFIKYLDEIELQREFYETGGDVREETMVSLTWLDEYPELTTNVFSIL